jgi:hypothetical protein
VAVNVVKRASQKHGWFRDRDLWDDPGVKEAVAATRYLLEEYKEAVNVRARKEKYPMHLEGLSEMHDRLKGKGGLGFRGGRGTEARSEASGSSRRLR